MSPLLLTTSLGCKKVLVLRQPESLKQGVATWCDVRERAPCLPWCPPRKLAAGMSFHEYHIQSISCLICSSMVKSCCTWTVLDEMADKGCHQFIRLKTVVARLKFAYEIGVNIFNVLKDVVGRPLGEIVVFL